MNEHDQPVDTLQDLINLANEPLKLFIHLLYQVNDGEGEVNRIATIADALQEASTARIAAAFRAVEEHVGTIGIDGLPEGFGNLQPSSRFTAILKEPKKSA